MRQLKLYQVLYNLSHHVNITYTNPYQVWLRIKQHVYMWRRNDVSNWPLAPWKQSEQC